ncbi:hypothetical protein CDD83_8580 [Cordyceps sp. RAO-2017]|nr:hypothetical protein CDD83_8580 [Cordyceps sp. RAO-2017]
METEAAPLIARDLRELHHVLQKRDCPNCGDASQLQCPRCPTGQVCQYTVPSSDCSQCAQTVCMIDDSQTASNGGNGNGNSGSGNGPSAAPIAGGVIGGLVLIATLTYLVWRFLIKPKRARMAQQSIYTSKTTRDVEKDNASRITHRSSTHTVHSIASTVLTRASNIIQIAYIPGVTNRATPNSSAVLVPPVPPIPMHHTAGNRGSNQDDQHFFVPGNLRDSTYSGISEFSDRTSYAHRSSIASTIYGRQAQVQIPAQTGMRAKPTVVSVKPGISNGVLTPPVPAIDFEKFGNGRPKSGASTVSVGSTLVNNANMATPARVQVVKLGGGPRKIDLGAKSEASSSTPSLVSAAASPEPSGHTTPRSSGATATTVTEDARAGGQGPFSDPLNSQKPGVGVRTLGAVMEDDGEEQRDGARATRAPGSVERGRSPFGDEHATKE